MLNDHRLPPAVAKLKAVCSDVSGEILHDALTEIRRKPSRFSPIAVGIIEAELKSHRRRVGFNSANKAAEAAVETKRPPANVSTATIAIASAFLLTGAIYAWMFVGANGSRPAASLPASQAAIFQPVTAAPKLTSRSLNAVLRLTDDNDPEKRDEAVFELGRRGAVAELERLESHPLSDVRAAVPLAMLLAGRTAHSRIPHLADRLTSPDESVRRNTITALRTLVARYGTYHEVTKETAQGKRSASRR